MRTLLTIDSFKGCMTSMEAEAAVGEALSRRGIASACLPVSDGGEGMLEAFTAALGGSTHLVSVHNQMMRRTDCRYGVVPGGTAIVEVAQACGLSLVEPAERNPMRATTYGVGELLARAIKQGYRNFIVGLGGSGTSDAGIGMIRALVDTFARGKTFDQALKTELGECRFTLASDVRNPLYGEQGAAMVFAPQKGADNRMVEMLDRRAKLFADKSAMHFGYDRAQEPGAGAAGGLGYAFMQYLGAEMHSGADLLLDMCHFDRMATAADLVITGEGRADRQTLMGKLPERILRRCQRLNIPAGLIAGRVDDRDMLLNAGFAFAESITPDGMSNEEAMKKEVAKENIRQAMAAIDLAASAQGRAAVQPCPSRP